MDGPVINVDRILKDLGYQVAPIEDEEEEEEENEPIIYDDSEFPPALRFKGR